MKISYLSPPAFPALRQRWGTRFAALLALNALVLAGWAQLAAKWQIEWTDHGKNPVDLKSTGSRAYMPYVLWHPSWPAESRYRVWYDIESINGLGYSTSADGINWSSGQPLTGLNADGSSASGRPVVLYQPTWAKPYRLYYYGNPGGIWQVRVAEGTDGVRFENDQVALEGGRLGTFPDGHAVAYIPGRTLDPNDPAAERPFIMYFQTSSGIAYATSQDGYSFLEAEDDWLTEEVDESLISITGLEEGATFTGQPTQVLQVAQNDFRLFVFTGNTAFQYLVSANGLQWQMAENPVPVIGELGAAGTWNDQRNYYASAAYLGDGRFFLMRGGRDNTTTLYRTGVAFGRSAFYEANDLGTWAFYSPFNDYRAEGWTHFTTTGNEPDGAATAIVQNPDGTVSVRDRKESGNFYMVRDAALVVPFTYEFRAKLDDATGTGGDAEFPKYMVGAFQTDALHPGGEAWQPAFAPTRFGGWSLATDPSAEADNTQFQTYTVACRFDESARARLAVNPNDATANVALCVYDVYLNRDFSAPQVTFRNTGFAGWGDAVDADGRLDIGFPGPSAGQVTVDWIRWGNGVILDSQDPGPATPTVLTATPTVQGITLSWSPAGGRLQATDQLGGAWADLGTANPVAVQPTDAARFFRVIR
jgi:hypothetical protein